MKQALTVLASGNNGRFVVDIHDKTPKNDATKTTAAQEYHQNPGTPRSAWAYDITPPAYSDRALPPAFVSIPQQRQQLETIVRESHPTQVTPTRYTSHQMPEVRFAQPNYSSTIAVGIGVGYLAFLLLLL